MHHYLRLSVLLVTILSDVATAQRWREISGRDQWSGLLDPLDIELRREIIRYGELAQATSDAFIGDPASPYAGASRYGPGSFFHRVQAPDPGAYRVTRFVYATSGARLPDAFVTRPVPAGAWSTESNWMGYVAVATDRAARALGRRDVVVAWRGTKRMVEWTTDLDIVLVPAAGVVGPGRGSVHRGFLSLYTSRNSTSRFNKQSAREQVLTEVRRLLDTYKDENCSVTLTGHSLGAALSTLNAVDLVANGFNAVRSSSGHNITVPVTAILFGSPRVGDEQFKKALDSMSGAVSLLRVRNAPDIVPTVLPTPFYRDVGVELLVDTLKSPYLKTPAGPAQWHNLECYLHAVAGTQGTGDDAGFSLEVDRDVALVNKEEDALKGEYPVPASWWAEKNKGMVKNATGHWVLEDHEEGNLAL